MLRRSLLFLSALLALVAPLPALAAGGASAGPIVFNGLIVQDGKIKVSLYNPNTLDAKWVQVGKKFGSYTVGFQPADPKDKKTQDTVLLTLNGSTQRIALQDAANLSTNTPVVATTAAQSALAAQNAASAAARLDVLNRQLADARNDPNTNPQLLQALEQTIQRQQQLLTTGNAGVNILTTNGGTGVLTVTNNSNGATSAVARTTLVTNPDGTRTTTTYDANGKVMSVSTQSAPNPAAGGMTTGIIRE